MRRIKESAILLGISFIFLFSSFNPTITGNIIGNEIINFSILQILAFAFLIGSLIMFASRKTLDVLIIPTGQGMQSLDRAERALEEWGKGYIEKLMISGEAGQALSKNERAHIYKYLRKNGVEKDEILISGGKDSVGNIEDSFKKLEDAKNVGIVSYPEHLNRFEYILNKAKEEGMIDKNIKLKKIPTEQSFKDYIYGKLANVKERYNLRQGIKKSEEKESISPVKGIGYLLKKIFG